MVLYTLTVTLKFCLCLCLYRDLRFIEVVENVCQRLLEYNLHKERTGSNRFAKVSVCPSVCNTIDLLHTI